MHLWVLIEEEHSRYQMYNHLLWMHPRPNLFQTKVNPYRKVKREEEEKRITENLLRKYYQVLVVDPDHGLPPTQTKVTNQCKVNKRLQRLHRLQPLKMLQLNCMRTLAPSRSFTQVSAFRAERNSLAIGMKPSRSNGTFAVNGASRTKRKCMGAFNSRVCSEQTWNYERLSGTYSQRTLAKKRSSKSTTKGTRHLWKAD